MANVLLQFCDSQGNPTNNVDPRGDVYVKCDVSTTSNATQAKLEYIVAEDNTSYVYNQDTIFLSNLQITLGSGNTNCNTDTGFDDWSLYQGEYQGGGEATGWMTDGFLNADLFDYTQHNNGQNYYYLPNYFTLLTGYNELSSFPSGNTISNDGMMIPQGHITALERASDDSLVSVLVKIENARWNNLFTGDIIDFGESSNNWLKTDMSGTLPEVQNIVDTITGGASWGNNPYDDLGNIDYGDIVGRQFAMGFAMTIGAAAGSGSYIQPSGGFLGRFHLDSNLTPYSADSIALVPYLYFGDEFSQSFDFYVNQSNVNLESSSVNVDEQVSGTFTFSVNDFIGYASVYVFDNSDIGTPEYASMLSSTLINTSYNEIDDMANYGVVNFDDGSGFGKTIEIADNQLNEVNFTYQPTGQIGSDSFTFYIVLHSLTEDSVPNSYLEPFEQLEPYQKILFGGSTTLDVNYQGFELTDEEYVPSEVAIENPSDVMFHLAEQELGYNQDVNVDKIVNARNNQSDFKLGFSVNEEIEGKNLFQEIAQSSKCVPTFNNGMFSFAYIQDTYTKTDDLDPTLTINAQDVIKYSVSRTPLDKIYTKVQVQYKYDYGLDNYLESVTRSAYNVEGIAYSPEEIVMAETYGITGRYGDIRLLDPNNMTKKNYYGLKFDKDSNKFDHQDTFLSIENKYIRDEQTAIKLAEHLVYLHMNVHNVIELTLPLKYYNLEVGDLCDFNEMIVCKKIYVENYVVSENDDMPIRCGQYILPLFMVTDITKSIKNVRIKLIQMHHNADSDLVWDNFTYPTYANQISADIVSGDINSDGFIDVLDIVQVVSHILGTQYLPFLQYGDANNDGAVNVLDIVNMVNSILGD